MVIMDPLVYEFVWWRIITMQTGFERIGQYPIQVLFVIHREGWTKNSTHRGTLYCDNSGMHDVSP